MLKPGTNLNDLDAFLPFPLSTAGINQNSIR